MFTHVTLMPVSLVNSASTAFGGATEARATVMVTPLVFFEPLLALLLPPQPAVTSARAASAATRVPPRERLRERLVILGMTPPWLSFPRRGGEAGLFTICASCVPRLRSLPDWRATRQSSAQNSSNSLTGMWTIRLFL